MGRCFMVQMFQGHGSARSGGVIRSAFNEAIGGTLNTNTSAIGAGIVKGLLKLATASSQWPPNRDKLRTALGEGGKNLAFLKQNLAFLKLSVADGAQVPRSREALGAIARRSRVLYIRP
jgi:hypothetical protein